VRFAHQTHFFGFAGFRDVIRFAFGFFFALFRAFSVASIKLF
jgi:hypothetical protein